jgi:hypothetical protein
MTKNNSPILIGISGKKRRGKDTVCDILLKLVPGAMRMAFADPLKDEVAAACGVSREFLEQYKANFRQILQGWGTEFRRELYSQTYWIDQTELRLEAAKAAKVPLVIITDVRFPNEWEFIIAHGGHTIRVFRDSLAADTDTHPSETALDSHTFDWWVDNNHSLEALEENVKGVWDSIQKMEMEEGLLAGS